MFKRISKLGALFQFILFIGLVAVFWIPAFLNPVLPLRSVCEGPAYDLIAGMLEGEPLASVILAFCLTLILCIQIYLAGMANDLFPRTNFLASIFLVVMLSWNQSMQTLHPMLPAAVLILLALHSLMKMYGQTEPYRQVFIASMFLSVASLFFTPAIYLVAFIWIVFLGFRITTWREWIIVLIGFAIPYIYLISWYFLAGDIREGITSLSKSIGQPGLNLEQAGILQLSWIALTILILLIAILAIISVLQDKLISIRRKSYVMINFSLISFLVVIFSGASLSESYQMLLYPLALFMAVTIAMIKRTAFIEALYLLYLLLLVVLRYSI